MRGTHIAIAGTVAAATTAAQLASQFAPVPWLGPAVEILCVIVQLVEQVSANKRAIRQLSNRCIGLLETCSQNATDVQSEKLKEALQNIMNTLEGVKIKMACWAAINKFEAFAMQREIDEDIRRCHNSISDCLTKFQIISHLEIHDWQSQFEANRRRDKDEIMAYLAEIQNSTQITQAALKENTETVRGLMSVMQEALSDNPAGNRTNAGLQSNLYQLQVDSKSLLPEFNLSHGEVTRVGNFPVSGSASMDIWEGMYLGREKVALKVVRAVMSDHKSLARFKREVKIWGEIWKIDGGRHVLPFYGFVQNDGPYPYMVSPWQPNGTAISYVKKYPDIDYRELIRGIAEGIRILHSLTPPVVHGDVKGSNIVIDSLGNPLIADFGVSRIVEDITGVPFSQSNGVSDSYRWFAPELCIGQGALTLSSDVYAFGMTILELITNQQPYAYIKHTTEVVIRSARGVRPKRPTEPHIVARGLDDNLWNLLMHCWDTEPTARPSIHDVLARLPS